MAGAQQERAMGAIMGAFIGEALGVGPHWYYDLFPLLDGNPRSGAGHYTSESIRHAWKRLVAEKRPWHDIGGAADTTEAMERTLAIAVRYAAEPARLSQAIANNTALTQSSETMLSMGVGYGCILGLSYSGRHYGRSNLPATLEVATACPALFTTSYLRLITWRYDSVTILKVRCFMPSMAAARISPGLCWPGHW